MKKSAKYAFLTLVLMFATAVTANAKPGSWWERERPKFDPPKPKFEPVPAAPEVDPGFAMGGLSLLAGALTVLRARTGK